jgi:16S rRNA (cytosine(1402)-N(4))-methyltransferase
MNFHHISVLLNECLDALDIKPEGTYVDCTLGGAGHSSEIFKRLNGGRHFGIDRDADAIEAATARMEGLNPNAQFTAIRGNFHDAKELLAAQGVYEVDGILADLGVSSHQLDVRERGFSYHDDAPLDMRMDRSQSLGARDIINSWSEDELNRILRDYGEEYRQARANLDFTAFGGESVEDLRARAREFLEMMASDPHENVAAFSHAGFIEAVFETVMNLELDRTRTMLPNASILRFVYIDGAWRYCFKTF